jgi:AcrR family transcriptional regulator
MPPPVDHEARRRHVVVAASRVLARSGLRGLTVREVAREAGYSTTVVTHFFKNKDELLTLVFKYNHAGHAAATEEARVRSGGDLKEIVKRTMLLEEESIDRWRVWLAYVAQLDAHPEIAAIHRDFTIEQSNRWVAILESIEVRGLLKPSLNIRSAVDRLIAAIVGMAISAIFDLEAWPPERQHALIDAELEGILKDPPKLPELASD